jgi:hypothetical protein
MHGLAQEPPVQRYGVQSVPVVSLMQSPVPLQIWPVVELPTQTVEPHATPAA